MDLCLGSRSGGGLCGDCRGRDIVEIGRWRNQLAQAYAERVRPKVDWGSVHCHPRDDDCLHLPSQW